MRTTIREVRQRFGELLAQTSARVEQVECVLCEDDVTAMFYAHTNDGEALAVALDLSAESASAFDPYLYVALLGKLH